MNLNAALALASQHGLRSEVLFAYRWHRRGLFRFFVSERRAVEWALAEWDLVEG